MYSAVFRRGVSNGLYVSGELAKAIIPVYILIKLLERSGILAIIAHWCAPVMNMFGLPGEASLLIVIGNCLNLYAILGGIQALDLNPAQINNIAVMLLISHSLFVESAVLKKAGTNALLLTVFRLVVSFFTGICLNLIF